ncbi:hypothetical protein LX99_01009 [Mucilaginibacter oryzae]|uniref:Uncharacterized protein n=1 Tax=Mucilaginibacter oryzae TaxID=468058 RepID=A0A316HKI3_9SPHI|nr:hypothetical protein LX99_01009 [Mucilaginibacter oryzae]
MRQVFIWLMGVFAPVMVPGLHDAVSNRIGQNLSRGQLCQL